MAQNLEWLYLHYLEKVKNADNPTLKYLNFKENEIYKINDFEYRFNCDKSNASSLIDSMTSNGFLKEENNKYVTTKECENLVPLSIFEICMQNYTSSILLHPMLKIWLSNSNLSLENILYDIEKNKTKFLKMLNCNLNTKNLTKNLFKGDFKITVDDDFKFHILNSLNVDMCFELNDGTKFYYFDNNINYIFSVFMGMALIKTIQTFFNKPLNTPIFIAQNSFKKDYIKNDNPYKLRLSELSHEENIMFKIMSQSFNYKIHFISFCNRII